MSLQYSVGELSGYLKSIILETAGVDIVDTKASLFGFKYSLSAEMFIYILERANTDIRFDIGEQFVNDLGDCSFENLVEAISKHRRSK